MGDAIANCNIDGIFGEDSTTAIMVMVAQCSELDIDRIILPVPVLRLRDYVMRGPLRDGKIRSRANIITMHPMEWKDTL